MDLDKLRYIITVGEERSFSKASKKLFISQPALSQYISGVENEIGCPLFDRKNLPLSLTPAGEIFIKRSKEIINLKHNMIKEIEDLTKNFAGTLTLGISPFRNAYILPKFLPELKKEFPNVKIKVVEKHALELEKDLEKGVVDLIVTSLPLASREFEFIEFCREETFVVTPKDERFLSLAVDGEIGLEKLKNESFILPYERIKLRDEIDIIFYNNNFVPNIFLETWNQESTLSLVESGMGVGFASEMSLKLGKWHEDLYFFPVKNSRIIRTFAIIYRKGKKFNDIESKFVEILCKNFKNFNTASFEEI